MMMRMGRYGVRCRRELNLVGTDGNDFIALMQAGDNLYSLAILCPELYLLLLISLVVDTEEDEV